MENTKFIQPEPNLSIEKSDRPVGMVIPTQNKVRFLKDFFFF